MWVYINRPEPKFSIHCRSDCGEIKKTKKVNQRQITIDDQSLRGILKDFLDDKYRFSSTSANNDMWINVNLRSYEHSKSLVYILQAILGSKYQPLADAPIKEHDCCSRGTNVLVTAPPVGSR